MTTPQQHAWFHQNRPDASIAACCWCNHETELAALRDEVAALRKVVEASSQKPQASVSQRASPYQYDSTGAIIG